MSPQKLLDVRILRAFQSLVRATENNITLFHHHHLAIDEAQALTFTLEYDLTLVVDHGIFRAYVLEIIHLVSNEDGRNVFEIPKFHCELTNSASCRRIQTCGRFVEKHNLGVA